jgi:hypothetical protein
MINNVNNWYLHIHIKIKKNGENIINYQINQMII